MNEFFVKAVSKEWPDQKIPTHIFGMMALYIEEGDWAYEHGMRNFDILVAFDGTPVNYLFTLKDLIKEYKPGDVVKLIVIRNGHFITIDYELGSMDFKDYLEFYDKSIQEQFEDKPVVPQEEEQKEPPTVTPAPQDPIPVPEGLLPRAVSYTHLTLPTKA